MLDGQHVALTLRAHAVRLTPCRRQVLGALLQSDMALSGTELEPHLHQARDRVTLYRTLRLLEQKGLIHRVVDYTETVRYAAAAALRAPVDAALPAEHVHFKCTSCQHIYCLPQVAVPPLPPPGRHHVTRRDCLLSGVCERCLP